MLLIFIILAIINCASTGAYKKSQINLSGPPEPDTGVSPIFEKCPKIPCSCSCDDPFDPRVMPKQGDFAGLCLNTCEQRSVRMLTRDQVAAHTYFNVDPPDSDIVFAANINHYDDNNQIQFYVAKIPLYSLKEIILQIEHIGGPFSHSQMRFSFDEKNPVVLVPQDTGSDRKEITLSELTFSAEALAPPGIRYKGDYAFKSEYFQAYRMTSLEVRAKKMIIEDHHQVIQYRLDLDERERKNVFLGFLDLGTRRKHDDKYHTISNNCILAIFSVLDSRIHVPWPRRVLAKMKRRTLFMPTKGPNHLRYRGLAKKGNFRMVNLEEELGWDGYIHQESR